MKKSLLSLLVTAAFFIAISPFQEAQARVSACLVEESTVGGRESASVECLRGGDQRYRVKLRCTGFTRPYLLTVYGPWVQNTAESFASCPTTYSLLYAKVDRR